MSRIRNKSYKNSGASQKPRYQVIHSFTGRVAFQAASEDAIRSELSKDGAAGFTIHDTLKGQFYSGEQIFKDLADKNHKSNNPIS